MASSEFCGQKKIRRALWNQITSLQKFTCSRIDQNLWLFDFADAVTDDMNAAFGTDWRKKTRLHYSSDKDAEILRPRFFRHEDRIDDRRVAFARADDRPRGAAVLRQKTHAVVALLQQCVEMFRNDVRPEGQAVSLLRITG
jgi:hypothetical protein